MKRRILEGRFRTARAQRQLLRCLSRDHPCKPPPHRGVHDPFQTASGVQNSGPRDPWQASDYKKKSLVYQQGAVGCRILDLGIRSYR